MAFKLTGINFGQGTKSSMKKDDEYDLALKNDPQLEKYIAKRKTLKKGTEDFAQNQYKINTAYYGKERAGNILEKYRKKHNLSSESKEDNNTTIPVVGPKATKTNKTSIRDIISTKLEEGPKTSTGFGTKTKTGINLFGQKRNVTKFYDPDTGEFAGKEITVTKKDGTRKQFKDKFGKKSDTKTKVVNPGLSQTGGVGKIREPKGYFGKTTPKADPPKTTIKSFSPTKDNRAEDANFRLNDPNVKKDSSGKPSIPSYQTVFDRMKTNADGKKVNPRNNSTYNNIDEFIKESEAWWARQAKLTDNVKLKSQNQPYGRQYGSSNKKRSGFKMKYQKK